jgi:hypothetical protein
MEAVPIYRPGSAPAVAYKYLPQLRHVSVAGDAFTKIVAITISSLRTSPK